MRSIMFPKIQEHKFPKLMIFDGDDGKYIVLFHNSECGIVVFCENQNWEVGEYSENWAIECFTDFIGTIELSND